MKQLIGHDIGTYAFNAPAGTVTISGVTLTQEQLLLIVDATAGVVIYNFAVAALGGSFNAGTGVLTLTVSTAALYNADSLLIYVDIPKVTSQVAEQQIVGVRDNGTEQGIVSTEIKRGNLVFIPASLPLISVSVAGSASGGTPNTGFAPDENFDGSGSIVVVTAPVSASFANYASWNLHIRGNVFGLRFDPNYASGNPLYPPIGCLIDGVAYPITPGPLLDSQTYQNAILSSEWGQIVATDLGDGDHNVSLLFPCTTTGTQRVWAIYGFLVDGAAGYVPYPRAAILPTSNPTAVPTSYGTISSGFFPNSYGIRKLLFYNSTGSAIQVSVRWSTNGNPFWSMSVPATSTVELDFTGPVFAVAQQALQFLASGAGVTVSGVGVA